MQLRLAAQILQPGGNCHRQAVRISSSQSGSQARTVLSIASRQRPKNRGGRPSPSSLCSRARRSRKSGTNSAPSTASMAKKLLKIVCWPSPPWSRQSAVLSPVTYGQTFPRTFQKSAVYHSPAGRGSGWRQRDRDKISWCGPQGTFAGQTEAGRIERIRRAAGKIAIILHKAVFKQRSGVVFVQQRFQHHGVRREG